MLLQGGGIGLAIALLVVVLYWNHFEERAQSYDLALVNRMPEKSIVYDRHGVEVAWIDGENRKVIPLEAVPRELVQALLLREDSRFWEHGGLDWRGIVRAAVVNARQGEVRQGASTLTQQLVRNTYGLTERTLDRKLLEAMLALRFEKTFTKRQILDWYLNRVYFGAGAYGVERAAQRYFGVPAAHLDLAQSALLVALIRSPHRYSPFDHPKEAMAQRHQVLGRMMEEERVNWRRVREARRTPLQLHPADSLPNPQNYVMDAIRREMREHLSAEQIARGGLHIYTTLDPELQELAQKTVEEGVGRLERQKGWRHPRRPAKGLAKESATTPYLQGALVAVENRTGAIRALVGGRSYHDSRFDRATQARRQVGSTFKPLIYAMAFERGLYPGSLVNDDQIRPGEFADIPKSWSPVNADGRYGGLQPVSTGLIRSRNTMSVRVGEYVGLREVLRRAPQFGFSQPLPPYPAIFLGGFEATLREMVDAYTIFPNHGRRAGAHLIERMVNRRGTTLYTLRREQQQVIRPSAAWMTSLLLEEVLKSGTASRARRWGFHLPAGGKTGTTNRHRDAWFIGYTSSLTCGVWVGFDRPRKIASGGYGSTLALPLWTRFVGSIPASQYPALPLASQERTLPVYLCMTSNQLAANGCFHAGTAYDTQLPLSMLPGGLCQEHEAWPEPVLADQPPQPSPSPPPVAERKPTPPKVTPAPAATPVQVRVTRPERAPRLKPPEVEPPRRPSRRTARRATVRRVEAVAERREPRRARRQRERPRERVRHDGVPFEPGVPVRRAIPVEQ